MVLCIRSLDRYIDKDIYLITERQNILLLTYLISSYSEATLKEKTSCSPAAQQSRSKPQVLFWTESQKKAECVFSETSALPALGNAQDF